MFKKIAMTLKRKSFSLLTKLYTPILQNMEKPIGGGGLEMIFRKEFITSHYVLSLHSTLQTLLNEKRTFIRLGDGELPIFHKKSGGFHSYNEKLREKLLEAYYFALDCRDFLIGVNPDLIYPFTHINDPALISSCKHYQAMDFLSFFPLREYGNAFLLRSSPIAFYKEKNPNIQYTSNQTINFYHATDLGKEILSYYKNNLIQAIKSLWKDKHIIICEGHHSCFGIFNDLFDNTKSIHRIQASNHNAFLDYENILQEALKQAQSYQNDEVYFICALGHASKILLVDLYKKGYRYGLDAGNLSIAYDSVLYNFPSSWIDDPVQMFKYPPLYYGKKLQKIGEN